MFRALLVLLAAALAGCSETAQLTVAQGTGADPALPPPESSLPPTVNVADAEPWKNGRMPTPAAGLTVRPFTSGFEHPRWLAVLPNGALLVADDVGNVIWRVSAE